MTRFARRFGVARLAVVVLVPAAALLMGAYWLGENLQPSAANLGEVGDTAAPFGAGNFREVDAGTVNVNTLSLGGVSLGHLLCGCDAGTSALMSVTFATAFANPPSCHCSDTSATLTACDATARATTGATFKSTGTDTVCWCCNDVNNN